LTVSGTLKIKVINHSTTIFKHDLSVKKSYSKMDNESEKQKSCKRKATTRKNYDPSLKFKKCGNGYCVCGRRARHLTALRRSFEQLITPGRRRAGSSGRSSDTSPS
jgi:hypothetical protein